MPLPKSLYSVAKKGDHFVIKKFDLDIELQSEYKLTVGPRGGMTCDCPQFFNRQSLCRHIQMLRGNFLPEHHIGDGYLLCYETGEWTEPPL